MAIVTATAPSDLDLTTASDSGQFDTDDITKTTTPVITGKATAGATVVLYEGSTTLGSAVADGAGVWTITSRTLSAGVHKLTAKSTEAGVVSAASAVLTITVDNKAPVAPTALDLLASADSGASSTDNITNITHPVIAGKAEAFASVALYDGATLLGTASAGADGKWEITSGVALSAGVHSLSAKATDLAGNVSPAATISVTIATSVAAPTALDLAATSDKGASSSDNLTSVTAPVITGKAAAGATVILYDGSTQVGKAVAGSSGAWSITTSKLADGAHHLSATATDLAGNVSAASAELVVTVDATPAAVSTAPLLDAASDTGRYDNDNNTSVAKPTVGGVTEAGVTVTLYDGTTVLGTTVADSNGDWSITSSKTLSNGTHNLTIKTLDAAGNLSAASPALALTVDTRAATAPTALDLVASADSGASATDNLTNVTKPVIAGKAEAYASVSLYEGSTLLGTGIADAKGNWQVTSTIALGDGAHSLTAKATDLAGNASTASAAFRMTIDTSATAPSALDLTAAADRGASNTDNITNLNKPVITGKADAGATVVLYDGVAEVGKAVASATGLWSITSSKLPDGVHDLTAVATDVAGNLSAASGVLQVTIDTTAAATPAAPVLAAASDSGASDSDLLTKVTKPQVSGNTEAGATVTLYDGGTVVGTTVADGSGDWSITSKELAAGTHKLLVRATDVAGNLSLVSDALVLTIDTTAAAAPTALDLLSQYDTGASNTDNKTAITTPVISGKADANISVSLYDGTILLGSTTADSDGAWQITSGSSLSTGVHKLTAKTTDLAGNVSAASAVLSLTIDPTATGQTLTATADPDELLLNSEAGAIKVIGFSAKNGDHLVLAHDYNGLSLNSAADVLALAHVVGKDLVIDLGAGHEVTLIGNPTLTEASIIVVGSVS